MKPYLVVMHHVLADDSPGVLQRERRARANALAFDGAVKAFDLAVALRIVGRRPHMRHAAQSHVLLEFLGDKLRAVVADDARRFARELFTRPLVAARISQCTIERL